MTEAWMMEITLGHNDGLFTTTGTTQRLTFATKEAAYEQLRLIEPKIGLRKQNDPDKIRHTVISDDGELILDASGIQAARVVDTVAFDRNLAAEHAHRKDKHLAWLKELKAAGLIGEIKSVGDILP